MLPSSHSQEELLIANEKKKWDREGKFYQQKKEEKNPTFLPLFSHFKNSFNASVSSALAAEISVSSSQGLCCLLIIH